MQAGSIFFDPNFVFHDGEEGKKFLISLGHDKGISVVVKTTSQGHRYENTFGCQVDHRFPSFFLPKSSCCLPLPTWVCLDEYYEFNDPEMLQKRFSGGLYQFGLLTEDLAKSLLECAASSVDISKEQEEIVQQSLLLLKE